MKEAGAYFLRLIMHDYSDKYYGKILKAIVPAMEAIIEDTHHGSSLASRGSGPGSYWKVPEDSGLSHNVVAEFKGAED